MWFKDPSGLKVPTIENKNNEKNIHYVIPAWSKSGKNITK